METRAELVAEDSENILDPTGNRTAVIKPIAYYYTE
jgi:hypothetical protein